MATKWKNDLWSIVAVLIALFTLLYGLAFMMEIIFDNPTIDIMTSLRLMSKGEL